MLRIAILSWESKHSIAVGGLGEHVSELGAALSRRGHEVHIFTRIGANQSGYDRIDGVHYHRCPYETHPDFLVDNARMCDSFVWHLMEAESHVNAPFDVIHGHDWLSVHALTHVKNRHGRPVVMSMHSTEYGRCGNQLFEGGSRRIREIEWEGTYVAQRIICVSGVLCKEVQDLYSVPTDKLDVIYNGIDVKRFDERIDTRSARRRYAIGDHDPMVLFAGRMTRQKGPDILVEALPVVLEKHAQAKFVFAGDGDLRTALERRVLDLGVAPATRFVGHRSGRELVSLFKSADLVCVPSRNEPFGIVILEAWGARKPVVATRNGGPAEFVKHTCTGLTVSDDHGSIGWGVDAVLTDRNQGRRMGRNGRKEAETRFSWETVAAATERVYQSVVTGTVASGQGSGDQQEINGMARQGNGKTSSGMTQTTETETTTSKPTKSMKTATKTKRDVAKSTSSGASAKAGQASQRTAVPPALAANDGPTYEEICNRAYQIYLARNRAPGDPVRDWLQAEQELRNQLVAGRT